MLSQTTANNKGRRKSYFFFFLAVTASVIIGLALFVFGFSFLQIIPLVIFPLLLFLLFFDVKFFLFIFLFFRMIIDFLATFGIVQIGNFYFSFSQIIGIELFILGIIYILTKRNFLKNLALKVPFLVFIIWSLITITYSFHPSLSSREIVRFFDVFILFFISFSAIKKTIDLKQLLQVIFLSSIIPIAIGLYQFITGIGFQDETVSIPRIFGTFSHPNVMSLFLFSLVILGLFYIDQFAEKPKRKSKIALLSAFYAIIMLITYTRIAWIALFAFFILIGFQRSKKVFIPLIILPLLIYLAVPSIQDRAKDSLVYSPDSSIVWRVKLWDDTIQKTIADNREVFGYGFNTFPRISEDLRGIQFGSNEAHNDFVKIFVEGGYVGLSVYIFFTMWVITYFFWRYRTAEDETEKNAFGVLLSFFIALTLAGFSDNVFKNTPVLFIFWSIAGATLSLFKKK